MILFCYFQVKPLQQVAFDFAWKDALEVLNEEVHRVEADNHSEGLLIQEISKMINEASEIICFFEVVENEKLGSLAKVFESLRKSSSRQLLMVKGENEHFEKVLPLLKQNTLKCESEIQLKKTLSEFIKA